MGKRDLNINKLVGFLSIRYKLTIAFFAVACIPISAFIAFELKVGGNLLFAIGVIGAFLLSVLIAGIFASKQFTRPIEELREGTKSLAQGNLNHRLNIQTNDEIELLANDFNNMAQAILDLRSELQDYAFGLEELVKKRTIEIEKETQKLDNIVKGIGTGLALVNRETKISWYNHPFQEWFGEIDVSEGLKFYEFVGISPDDCPASKTLVDGRIRQIEHAMVTHEDKKRIFQITIGPIREGSDIVKALVMIQDITARKELEARVIHQERMAALGVLAAGVAHEIGNPLASLSSLVQYNQRKYNYEPAQEMFSLMQANIDRISNIVREMANFSYPRNYEWRPSNVNDLIKSALGIAKYDPRAKQVEIKAPLEPGIPLIKALPDQLLQVFLNIILNSFDAMPKGGELIITSKHEDGQVKIAFQDNGSGIDKESIERVFEPFFTTKDVGEGVGLGLSVSYGIIKNLGGQIMVESEVERGTTFLIILPLEKESDERVHTYS